LYRFFVSTKNFKIDIFETESWKPAGNYVLLKDSLEETDLMYEHNGRSNVTKEKELRWMMTSSNGSKPLINVVPNDGRLKIRCANYEELPSTLSYLTGSSPGGLASALFASLFYSNLLNSLITSPHLTRYFYVELNTEKNTFSRNSISSTAFNKVYTYLLQLGDSRNKILYAGYTQFKNGILGVYLLANSKEIQLLFFEN
jgi:hypothetical protein